MTKAPPLLTKTCAVCGLQKPISAFLQLSEEQGTTYGSVCASCRHELKDKTTSEKDIEESSRTSTGLTLTIDTNARIKGEMDKKDVREQVEEIYHEERDKAEEKESKELFKTEQIRKEEKKHRESFLSRRPAASTEKKGETPRTIETRQQTERVAQEARGMEKTTQLEQAAKAEEKEKGIDFTVPFIDTQIVGKVKYTQNPLLQLFLERERGLAMNRIFGQTPQTTPAQQPPAQQQKSPLPTQKPIEKSEPKQPAGETPSQEVERKWGPRSR